MASSLSATPTGIGRPAMPETHVHDRLFASLYRVGFYPARVRVERAVLVQDAYGAMVEDAYGPTILYEDLPATIGRADTAEIEAFALETYEPVARVELTQTVSVAASDRLVNEDTDATYDILAIVTDSQDARTRLLVREAAG